jgi:UDP-N-acetylmuramoyl-L-alanyl-D-glutamate--2,6-diaminopimelate ligase
MTDIAVLNKDDQDFNFVRKEIGSDISLVTYGVINNADYKGKIIDMSKGTRFTVNAEKKSYELKTNLEGKYNVLNSLAAVSVVRCLNIGWPVIHRAMERVPSMSGRLEEIKNKKGINIYIDFAHTSDSLENVLKLLKTKTKRKLIVVFGCAGERDKEKRRKMGEVAGRLANISILTAEDPRSEKIEDIIESISQGEVEVGSQHDENNDFNKKGQWFIKVPERGEAIALAIQKYAQKGDTVVVCGKGHEKSMCYGTFEYPWSDHEAIDLALKGGIKVINR